MVGGDDDDGVILEPVGFERGEDPPTQSSNWRVQPS